jgi:hypothetical protein
MPGVTSPASCRRGTAWRNDKRPIFFLLDAFNEIADDERRAACRLALEDLAETSAHTYIISTRAGREEEAPISATGGVATFDLEPLSDAQLRSGMRRRDYGDLFEPFSRDTLD